MEYVLSIKLLRFAKFKAIYLIFAGPKIIFLTFYKLSMQSTNLSIALLCNCCCLEIIQNVADIRRSVIKLPKRLSPFIISIKLLVNHLEFSRNLSTK